MAKVLDTEVYRRYCLIGFIDSKTRKIVDIEAVDNPFTIAERKWLRDYMRSKPTVSFNGNGFDLPIIYGAIYGFSPAKLKRMADDIIIGEMKPWDIEEKYKIEIPRNLDHIDLIEVAPGKASLKIYNGRRHGKRMQDLPIDPNADLTDAEIDIIYKYWKNDLDATVGLYEGLKTQLDLRAEMSKQYKVDLRSKSDAQVAEAVIKAKLTKLLGKTPKRPEFSTAGVHRYRIPEYISYFHPALNEILDKIEHMTFKVGPSGKIIMPDELAKAAIRMGNAVYRMGIGGLHSSEEIAAHVADDENDLYDRDVASFYPRIILNLGLFPKQLGKLFLKVYEEIVNTRLKAKAEAARIAKEMKELEASIAENSNGNNELRLEMLAEMKAEWHKWNVAAEGLKITINGSFGKLGSKWSILFAPDLMIQTTITGQLSLLMLIDRFHHKGFEVISANTDGIIIKVPKARKQEYLDIIAKWEKNSGFLTEETAYKAVYSRDVNNYIAVKTDGSSKRKGQYAKSGLEEKKNPQNEICAEAIVAMLTKGVSITKTIKECQDIRKFITVRTVRGGATKDGNYLGKAIRWYHSTATETAIHYKSANKSGNHNKVPKSDQGMPIMDLPEAFPSDVDYSYYIRETRKMLHDIGFEDDLIGKPTRKKKAKVENEELVPVSEEWYAPVD